MPRLRACPAQPSLKAASLAALLMLGCGPEAWLAGLPAAAQTGRSHGLLIAARELRLQPGAEIPLGLTIDADWEIPKQAMIVIRGMPAGMQLSEGRAFGPGVWVVPASELGNVKLRTPMAAKAGGLLSVSLATPDGASLDEARIMLVLPPSAAPATASPTPPASLNAAVPPSRAAPPVSQGLPSPLPAAGPRAAIMAKPTAQERASLMMLVAKGEENLGLGNILVARQFFLRAAERGLPEAAIALAATYDARELARMKTVAGVAPDVKLARRWYEHARVLGSTEAALRLRQLPQP